MNYSYDDSEDDNFNPFESSSSDISQVQGCISVKQNKKASDKDFNVTPSVLCTVEEVYSTLSKDVDAIKNFTTVNTATAILLLRKNGWNVERTNVDFFAYEGSSKSDLFRSINVNEKRAFQPDNTLLVYGENGVKDISGEVSCGFCGGEIGSEERGAALSSCRHFFHVECWSAYLEDIIVCQSSVFFGDNFVDNKKNLLNARCMEEGCSEILDFECIKTLLSNNKTTKQSESDTCNALLYYFLSPYVLENSRYQFCRSVACAGSRSDEGGPLLWSKCNKSILHLPSGISPSFDRCVVVQCENCSLYFCFHCQVDSSQVGLGVGLRIKPEKLDTILHTPCRCVSFRQFKDFEFSDGASMYLILKDTKFCPKCNIRINRSGGCNHMTCSQCHYEFCYMCFGEWSKHLNGDSYSCANAVAVEDPQKQQIKNMSKHQLFAVVYKKYLQQLDSRRLDEVACEKIYAVWMGTEDFLLVIRLIERTLNIARRVLANSYIELFSLGIWESADIRTDSKQSAKQNDLLLFRIGLLERETELLSKKLKDLLEDFPRNVNSTNDTAGIISNAQKCIQTVLDDWS